MSSHRRLLLVRGDEDQTREQVERLLATLPERDVAWISTAAPTRACVHVQPNQLSARLGQAFDVVVIDAHRGLDADLLGQAHGLVFGGGALVLRLQAEAHGPKPDPRLAVFPHSVGDVGQRFATHVERVLASHASPLPSSLSPADRNTAGTPEQAELVARLLQLWCSPAPTRAAIVADRGRGKSSALGLALRALAEQQHAGPRFVTAGNEEAIGELLRFAGEQARFVPLLELLATPQRELLVNSPRERPVIVVDEAAQLPVPLLERLVLAQPHAHLAFASTTHGYEGTGRGFALRFLTWLARQGPLERLHLRQPIRWSADDPLERAVFEALLLDAEPAVLDTELDAGRARMTILDRDALVTDLPRLRELFGLLVHAHYRTTPSDLHRLLDAPNLELHAALLDDHIVGACVVAREGGLSPELIDAARSGRTRLRAHALADVLIAHLGHAEAGPLHMRRTVRTAVHPALRRQGIASRLLEHVHASHPVDLFGTLFGASPELIEFRRRLGYQLVRVSAARGARTGEPSVLMIKPNSEPAQRLVAELRRELAREIDIQFALLQADDGLTLAPDLLDALRADLPAVPRYRASEQRALAHAYAHGPRTFESVATAVRGFVEMIDLAVLPTNLRAVVEGRVLQLHGWRRITQDVGMPSVSATMRALRRALRLLVD